MLFEIEHAVFILTELTCGSYYYGHYILSEILYSYNQLCVNPHFGGLAIAKKSNEQLLEKVCFRAKNASFLYLIISCFNY